MRTCIALDLDEMRQEANEEIKNIPELLLDEDLSEII